MEKITAVLREERLPIVLAALRDLGYGGITISQVRGHGRQRGVMEQWRGNEFRVDFLPKAKLELVVGEQHTDSIIAAISENARTGAVGDGKIWVTPVSRLVRVRTGETGEAAI
ncbi:MAG TPA: P-II family nitrogen regulator [Dehalococcoidia bacterium]|nr:P-II family nitrogen regulator [Dehalococcoidia bacterium]